MYRLRLGFSVLELVVTLALISLVSTVVVSNIVKRTNAYQKKIFVTTLNSLVKQAWIASIKNDTIYKIIFNIAQQTVRVEKQDTIDSKKNNFIPVQLDLTPEIYYWPKQIHIKEFYIQGVDEFARHGEGKKMEDVWFFILPNGLSQEVVINAIESYSARVKGESKELSLVLNPFKVEFEDFSEFQQPEAV